MLSLVQPVGVEAAIVGRIEDLHDAVTIQIGRHGVRHVVLDQVVVLA